MKRSPEGKEDWQAWEQTFTQKEIKAVRKAALSLRKGFPWLLAPLPPQARTVAFRAGLPRSKAGARQDDPLWRVIHFTKERYQKSDLVRLKIVETLNGFLSAQEELNLTSLDGHLPKDLHDLFYLVSELDRLHKSGEPCQPKTDSEFFSAITKRLKYLENFKPTISDYAVEVLQNAFVGLMELNYEWGKKGLPTKGEVTKMANTHLQRQGKSWKGSWARLLRTAGLGFLRPGKAGAPRKQEVDQNRKARQALLAMIAKAYDGDIVKAWEAVKASRGSKKTAQQDELQRLTELYGLPRFPEEDEESA